MTGVAAKSDPVLEVRDLTIRLAGKQSTVNVVETVSFSIATGQAMGLVGESGSGKTMTALALISLLPRVCSIAKGSIKLNGRELVGLSERELQDVRGRDIGMIFQDPMSSLDPCFTVGDQIAEVLLRHKKIGRRAAFAEAADLLDMVKIPAARQRLGEYPHTFSGGMRQRVMIAMALACRPKLLIADEPTTALDVTVQAQILDLIAELQENHRIAVVLVSHDLSVVANICDHVSVLYAGHVIEAGTRSQLFRHPQHPYTAALLASNMIHDKAKPLQSIPGTVPMPGMIKDACRFSPRCAYCVPEVCLNGTPELETLAADAQVRCARHDDIELRGTA